MSDKHPLAAHVPVGARASHPREQFRFRRLAEPSPAIVKLLDQLLLTVDPEHGTNGLSHVTPRMPNMC